MLSDHNPLLSVWCLLDNHMHLCWQERAFSSQAAVHNPDAKMWCVLYIVVARLLF